MYRYFTELHLYQLTYINLLIIQQKSCLAYHFHALYAERTPLQTLLSVPFATIGCIGDVYL